MLRFFEFEVLLQNINFPGITRTAAASTQTLLPGEG
jgi:hypothetical protein